MEHEKTLNASIHMNIDFINIVSMSGYNMKFRDCKAYNEYFDHSVSNEILGKAILTALNKSKAFDKYDHEVFQEMSDIKHYNAWVKTAIDRYSYKNKAKMFKCMLILSVSYKDSYISFMPRHQCKSEAWEGTGKNGEDHVIIPADSTDEEIGAAARLALSRCSSKSHYDPILEKLAKHD